MSYCLTTVRQSHTLSWGKSEVLLMTPIVQIIIGMTWALFLDAIVFLKWQPINEKERSTDQKHSAIYWILRLYIEENEVALWGRVTWDAPELQKAEFFPILMALQKNLALPFRPQETEHNCKHTFLKLLRASSLYNVHYNKALTASSKALQK